MKKLILIILIVVPFIVYSQGTIDVNITQDVKLALMEDGHGNTPFTPNVRVDVNLNGGTHKTLNNWGFIGVNFEYANLYGGDFYRFGLQGGIAVKTGLNIPFSNIHLNTTIEPYVGVSNILRERSNSKSNISFEAGAYISIKCTNKISIINMVSLMQRGDLERFKDTASGYNPLKWQPQYKIGARISLN